MIRPRLIGMSRNVNNRLLAGAGLAVTTLVIVSVLVVAEWRRSGAVVAQRRADATADAIVAAFNRDMRGVQLNVLSPTRIDDRADVFDRVTSGFARYPYPEVFFLWNASGDRSSNVTFYARSTRYPAWLPELADHQYLPVVTTPAPDVAAPLLHTLESDASASRRVAVGNLDIASERYQIVAIVAYRDNRRLRPLGAFGFLVNLAWARQHYFPELTDEVARLASVGDGMYLTVRDARGQVVVSSGGDAARQLPARVKTFSSAFFDPVTTGLDRPLDDIRQEWSIEAAVAEDPALRAASTGTLRALAMAGLAAVTLVASCFVMIRAVAESNKVSSMRSEFVASVTHELKTPIATIRAVSQTLDGPGTTPEMTREFARITLHEAKRLSRLIDNLLAYSRVTDVTEVYTFEPVRPLALVEEVLKEFSTQLHEVQADVSVVFPPDLPPVLVDRTAAHLMFANVIDNAIRFAPARPVLQFQGSRRGDRIAIEIADNGRGIPAGELEHVTRRFFRGRSARPGGSGLGLAIVQRIVNDHRGTLTIASAEGDGTRVTIALPIAESPA